MAEPLIWLNGDFVPKSKAQVSVFDHGLLYGDGCFEGIKSIEGKVFKLKEHIDRFYDSAHFLMIKLVQTKEEMMQICLDSLAVNDIYQGVGYIRLVATRGIGDLGINPRKCTGNPTVFCIAATIQIYPEALYRKGIKCVTVSTRRNSVQSLPARVKSLNYLNNVLGIIEANQAKADEGIMLTAEGHVSEATVDNIFFVKNGVIKTPDTSHGILEGITRNSVIEIAKRAGIPVEIGTYLTYDLLTADEAWLTGTAADMIPMIEVDSRKIGSGRPGPVFKKLRSLWQSYVDEPEHHILVPPSKQVKRK